MCPYHGGAYYRDGSRASGPPERELLEYPCKVENSVVAILAGELAYTGTPRCALWKTSSWRSSLFIWCRFSLSELISIHASSPGSSGVFLLLVHQDQRELLHKRSSTASNRSAEGCRGGCQKHYRDLVTPEFDAGADPNQSDELETIR